MELKVEDVSYSYSKENEVLKDINTVFEFGNIYLLYGKNGVGKSTFADIISGISVPTSGRIKYPPNFSSKDIGYQFQDFKSFSTLKVSEVIDFWKKINNLSNINEGVFRSILDIDSMMTKKVKSLSGGEARALSIFFICIIEKKIIILDEPFAGLDTKKKQKLSAELHNLVQQNKLIIIISHEVQGYEDLFDFVSIIKDGSISHVIDTKKIEKNQMIEILKDEIWGGENK